MHLQEKTIALKKEEVALLSVDIEKTRNWLNALGIMALALVAGVLLICLAGGILGILTLPYDPGPWYFGPFQILMLASGAFLGAAFVATFTWGGIRALRAGASAKKFLDDGAGEDILSYHVRLRKVLTSVGLVAVLGIVAFVISLIIVEIANIGTTLGII
ncbi:hypothetical protein JXM67_14310 [candidate division WOR-3 bacterium]|nr:hypothetical protein [candidate division WOR-3 bacterium]